MTYVSEINEINSKIEATVNGLGGEVRYILHTPSGQTFVVWQVAGTAYHPFRVHRADKDGFLHIGDYERSFEGACFRLQERASKFANTRQELRYGYTPREYGYTPRLRDELDPDKTAGGDAAASGKEWLRRSK